MLRSAYDIVEHLRIAANPVLSVNSTSFEISRSLLFSSMPLADTLQDFCAHLMVE